MKGKFRMVMLALVAIVTMASCTSVEPNHEGVLMSNYGRNGKSDFQLVTGRQNTMAPGTSLYQVPMYEQKADPTQITVTTADAGVFTVDPSYSYAPIRGKGVDIIFQYKQHGDGNEMFEGLEANILNPLVVNAYREEARKYATDSLMRNLNQFEESVEVRLKTLFEVKYFTLLPSTLSSGLTPPNSMRDAIEKTQKARQAVEEVKNQLDVADMELKKARIEAETNRVRSEGLTPKNLQEQWIEAIRTTQNKVIITDGKTPVIFNQ